MHGKDRTRIPRSSPPKLKSSLKATTPLYSPTPHHNVPILLRGTGKSASRLNPPSSVAGGTDHPTLSLPTSLDTNLPSSVPSSAQRMNGLQTPAPLMFQDHIGFGVELPLLPTSTSTSGLKTAPFQTSTARKGRPSFHVPIIHSPASKFVSTTRSESGGPGFGSHGDDSKPGATATPSPFTAAGKSPNDVFPTPPSLTRTPTAASNVSSESKYTIQSAVESTEGHHNIEPKQRNVDDIRGEEQTADTKSNGVDHYDEDVVLSPGFDVIQALADTNKFQNMDHRTPYEHYSPTTLRPRPFSRDISDRWQPMHAPPLPLASVVTHPTPSSLSTRVSKAHRRSFLAEAANMMLRNLPTEHPRHTYEAPSPQTSKSKTPPPHPHISGSISGIIQQIETLIGHPCVDKDAVHTAHQEAGVHSDTGSSAGAVFGVKLNITTRYASCSSVLGGQMHTLPLVVFACVEELYRTGLRSSRLLRPPPHAPATPSHTLTHSPANTHGATHSFPALVAAFNTPPTYGDDIDLTLASLDDVGALLFTYLDCLPGGIVPVWVRGVLGDAVGIYEEGHSGSDSMREQKRAIRVAQLVLRLLPAAQFSLLVYLLAFLSQIPLYEAWNGWSVRGVARAFARVVVGVGAGTGAGDVKGKGKDDSKAHKEEDVDWVTEEEDAVEVLEWLLASWDDLSDGLFLGRQRDGQERSDSNGEKQEDGKGEKERHRAAAMRQLDPPNTKSDDGTTTVLSIPAANNTSIKLLLARIASLERENAEWQWLQGQHKAELQRMFQAGEQRIAEVEAALMEERNARARAEDALMKERDVGRSTQTSTKDAARTERTLWEGEVQALREGWKRLGIAWEGIEKERDAVGNIMGRFVIGASGESEGSR